MVSRSSLQDVLFTLFAYLRPRSDGFLYGVFVIILITFAIIQIIRPVLRFVSVWRAASRFPCPPKSNWYSGHTPQITSDEDDIKRRRTFWKYGRVINWQIGSSNFVHATHSDTAKAILQREDPKEVPLWQFGKNWLGEGLLTSTGGKWNRNRKLITPAFHFSILRSYIPIFQRCFEKLVTKWTSESEKGQSVDVSSGMKFTTLECLLDCALGENGLTEMEKVHMLKELQNILRLWSKRLRTLWHYSDFIYKLSDNGRAFVASVSVVNSYCMRVIENCKRAQLSSASKESHSPTFVEILLKARDEDGKGLTTKEILDEVNTFVFAGHDTTGSAIPYCLYYLAKHPDWQETCRKEICDVMGDSTEIKWEGISSLKNVNMFIKECLRIASPLTHISRTTTADIHLKDELVIPKGCHVGALLESVHYNPDVWETPEVFDPLRFSSENAEKRHAYSFLAFSAGPRHCIGQSFAMTEIKVAIISALRRFRLKLDEDKPLRMAMKPVLKGSEDGTWLQMEHVD